jgi:hypothetical protein
MLWLYRDYDVIWNELRLFLIEGWQQSPGVGPVALTEEAQNNINWLCNEWPRSRGYHLSSMESALHPYSTSSPS